MPRSIISSVILIFTIGALTGCAAIETNGYRSAVNSWRGAHVSTLFHSWGKPTDQIKDINGHITYLYRTTQRKNSLHARHARFKTTCLGIFETDARGMIVHTEVRGTACPSNVALNPGS